MIEQLQKIEPQRDQLGYWIHPNFNHFYEQIAQGAEGLTKAQMEQLEKLIGHKISITEIFEELSEEDAVRLEKGDMDVISEWQPKPPNDKAFLVSIHDTDDGTVAWWATPKMTTHKLINEMQIAFEKAQAVKHKCDYEQLKANLDKQEAEVGNRYLVGFSNDWAVWQESWQAAQEQMIKNLYTRKMVCAIENRVQEQMDASGVQEPLHRLDGWTIVDSIVENINF